MLGVPAYIAGQNLVFMQAIPTLLPAGDNDGALLSRNIRACFLVLTAPRSTA